MSPSAADGVAACPDCGGESSAVARFCQFCGSSLAARDAVETRKVVTLLFCDVTGSTALGERVDPEVLRTVMSSLYDEARAVVARYGGGVEKFVGDAVLAVFGVPVAREDDALRAVRAAAELQERVRVLDAQVREAHGFGLAVRMGVNTGEVVVGAARSGGSFATGDAVNTAARLEQAAEPGEVLLGATTYELVRDAVTVRPAPPVVAKGKSEPLVAHRLLTVADDVPAFARRQDTPFVGRGRERQLLTDALARVLDSRTAQIVTVLGDAGVGKTRLVASLVESAGDAVLVLRGRCLSYGEGITFWPVVEIVRAAAGLLGDESPDLIQRRLSALLDGHPEQAALVRHLAPLLGAGDEPGRLPDTTWAVHTFVEHLATEAPLVVVVDDVHWAEPVLLDVITEVLERCRDLPLLVLCTARPEFLDARPGWGGGFVNSTSVLLDPLPDADARQILHALVGDVDAEVVQRLVAAAEGNPLFLEQLAAHVADAAPGTAGLRTVPATIAALLSARLDQLDEGDRTRLACAAVVGQAFHVDEVAALVDGHPGEVAAAFEALARRQLLRRDRDRGPGSFRFRHQLLRDAAYATQPKKVRAQRHERYARWLEGHPEEAGGEVAAFRGYHLEQAARLRLELSPGEPQASSLAAEAAVALAAASRLRERVDRRAAVNLLSRAIDLTADDRERLQRLLRLVALTVDWLRVDDANAALAAASELAARLGDTAALALLEVEYGQLQVETGVESDTERLLSDAHAAYARAAAVGSRWMMMRARTAETRAQNLLAHWTAMLDPLDEVIAVAAELDEAGMRDVARSHRLATLRWGPFPVSAGIDAARELVVDFADSPLARTLAERHLAALLAMNGQQDAARALIGPQPEDDGGTLNWSFSAAPVAAYSDDPVGAAAAAGEGGRAAENMGHLAHASTLVGMEACLLVPLDRDADAERAAVHAREITPPEDVISQALWRTALAVLAARRGDEAAARSLAAEAVDWVDRSDQLNEQGDIWSWVAAAYDALGDDDGARACRQEALARYEAKGNVAMAGRLRAALGTAPAR